MDNLEMQLSLHKNGMLSVLIRIVSMRRFQCLQTQDISMIKLENVPGISPNICFLELGMVQ